MLKGLRSCFGRIVTVVAILLALYAGWRWGPLFFPRIEEWVEGFRTRGAPESVLTPEQADSLLTRIRAFGEGEGGETLTVAGDEITGLLRYSLRGLLPNGVSEPTVRMDGDRVHVGGRVVLQAFPQLPDLGPVLGLLPDTLDVELEATLLSVEAGRGALLVRGIEASRIPLPQRLIPDILDALAGEQSAGLPPEALAFPLPGRVTGAYIEADSLVLTIDP